MGMTLFRKSDPDLLNDWRDRQQQVEEQEAADVWEQVKAEEAMRAAVIRKAKGEL